MKAYRAGDARYTPYDHLLSQPRVRVLRLMRFFDWMSLEDILNVVGETHRAASSAFQHALVRLVSEGHVERCKDYLPYHYRITASGRAEYQRTMARAEVTEKAT